MADSDIRAKTETIIREADEVTSIRTPAHEVELPVPAHADDAQRAEITRLTDEIDITDTQTILKFGSHAQEELTAISDEMLEGVRNKDVGPAGKSLREMVTSIRGFDVSELDPDRKLSWWEKLFRKATPVADFVSRYEGVRGQIDAISDQLLNHETVLLKDIKFLDKLYEKSLDFYNELALYITAGDAKMSDLDATTIPAKEAEVKAASQGEGVLRAQELRDIRAARDDLERRVHDLRLTRQVTMQSLPSIRLVQENDKSLVNKINSTLVNTVPLWQTQLAQAVTIFRSREAAGSVKEATDLTNELLTSNAENLQTANREVRQQMERGIFDIEAVKTANQHLIATIEESLQIADDGKTKRAAAEKELTSMEANLKSALSAAKARPGGQPGAGAETQPGAGRETQTGGA